MVGILETEEKLSETAFALAKDYISKALPWISKFVNMLNLQALRMYQGLNEEESEEFEKTLLGFLRQASKNGAQGTLSEAFGDA